MNLEAPPDLRVLKIRVKWKGQLQTSGAATCFGTCHLCCSVDVCTVQTKNKICNFVRLGGNVVIITYYVRPYICMYPYAYYIYTILAISNSLTFKTHRTGMSTCKL